MKLSHLFVAAAVFVAACGQTSCSGGSFSEQFADVDLIPVKLEKEGKWSLVNPDGKVVYDGEFANRPSCAINGYFSVEEGEGYTLYKIGGKNPEAVKDMEKLKYVGYVSDGLIPVTAKNSRITVMKPTGELAFELTPYKDAEIVECSDAFSEGMLCFETEDGKYGYYNTKGEVVINPIFDTANDFKEGLAVVGEKDDKTGDRKFSVIDKKGETVFKIKDGVDIEAYRFISGHLLLKEDDRYILCDKKGEMNKLPSKIESIRDYNDKYIIYRSENGYGVCDLNGEIIIRPKYKTLYFNTSNTFFAKKDGSDDEMLVLDKNGDQIGETLDYEDVYPLGKFGFLAEEGKTATLLNSDYKPKTENEYYDFGFSHSACYSVRSDYFNMTAIAGNMMDRIKGNEVGGIKLGTLASAALTGQNPSDYKYAAIAYIKGFAKRYYGYRINGIMEFNASITQDEWDSYNYKYNYYWNPEAKVLALDVKMNCDKEWGADGQKVLVNALTKAGYKTVVEHSELTTLLKKGKVLVLVVSTSNAAIVSMVDGSNGDMEDFIKTNIDEISSNFRNRASDESDFEDSIDEVPVTEHISNAEKAATDSAVVEECVVEECVVAE